MKPVYDCRYIENYQFTKCNLVRCKFHSEIVPSKCLAVDRVESTGDKPISDAEIHFYKLQDCGIQSRAVSLKRKEAVDRIKCIFILDKFLRFLEKQKDVEKYDLKSIEIRLSLVKPLSIKSLKFQTWMWKYLNNKEFDKFNDSLEGDSLEYNLEQVLWLSKPNAKKLGLY